MTKAKKKELVVEAATNESTGRDDQSRNPDVVIVKSGEAAKLSPRGEGGILYQVGRIGEEVLIRIEKNTGGGSCSKEWVAVSTILDAMTPAMHKGDRFKTDALAGTFAGKSQCNSGFLVAVLRAECLVGSAPDKKGLHVFVDSLESWARIMAQTNPVLTDGGVPLTAKRYLEPQHTRFKAKADDGEEQQSTIRKVRLIRKPTAVVSDDTVEPVERVEPDDSSTVEEPADGDEAS